MEYFDTHSHYNDERFDIDREEIINEVYNFGVTKIIVAGYDVNSSKKAIQMAISKDYLYAICGISPNDVASDKVKMNLLLQQMKEVLKETKHLDDKVKMRNKIVAIGEIGLDYHWNTENKELQKYAFVEQIKMANEMNLPIVIHTREAVEDTINILKNVMEPQKNGVFHCCPFNREIIKEALKLGFYISFAGPTTFKNSKNADEIINMVPLDRILIETDCPYLAPEPVRGSRNDSRNLKYIVEKIAIVRELEPKEIAKITYENAQKVFEI